MFVEIQNVHSRLLVELENNVMYIWDGIVPHPPVHRYGDNSLMLIIWRLFEELLK